MVKLKKITKAKTHLLTTLYGLPATGKTSFINTLEGSVLIIDTDRGLASIDEDTFVGDIAECDTFNDVLEALELWKDYDNIVIDHFTLVQELCYKYVMAKTGAQKMLINHYGEASTLLKHMVDNLVRMAQEKTVIVLAQQKSINIEDDTNEDIPQSIVPNLMESVRSHLTASSRVIGHTEITTLKRVNPKTKKRETKQAYTLRLGGSPVIVTKFTRKPGIPVPDVLVNPKWEDIVAIANNSHKTQEEAGE